MPITSPLVLKIYCETPPEGGGGALLVDDALFAVHNPPEHLGRLVSMRSESLSYLCSGDKFLHVQQERDC